MRTPPDLAWDGHGRPPLTRRPPCTRQHLAFARAAAAVKACAFVLPPDCAHLEASVPFVGPKVHALDHSDDCRIAAALFLGCTSGLLNELP